MLKIDTPQDTSPCYKTEVYLRERHCAVCDTVLLLEKEHVYTAVESRMPYERSTLLDAIDCPQCGCQNVLIERLPRLESEGDNNAG